MDPITRLTLTVSPGQIPKFFQLFEQGFMVESAVGCSLRDFVCNRLQVDEQCLAERVQTVFLDHTPVDDLDSARIGEGSTVALSAAMPGLAGATLRKGGRFAAMRRQLGGVGGGTCESDGQTTRVRVKFFNAVARELGQSRLEQGIRIQGSDLISFVDRNLAALQTPAISVQFDGSSVDLQDLASNFGEREVLLQVFVGE